MSQAFKIKRALISVSDKTDLEQLAKTLVNNNVEILATGGTAVALQKANIPIIEVADYTQFPEIMGGRVKTLHPKIHGGILARRSTDEKVLTEHNITPIDLVVVNLYPFVKTISQENCTLKNAIENIDIGGPSMVRAAAKNYKYVLVVVDPSDYPKIIDALNHNKTDSILSEKARLDFSTKAFTHTANYDTAISQYLQNITQNKETPAFPSSLHLQFNKQQDLRYGENPHQRAALYLEQNPPKASIATATQHQGKALSFNNLVDADSALECVKQFSDKPACVIVKHNNPCGVALGDSLLDSYQNAYACDSTAAFGGIIAFNQSLDATTTKQIIDNQFVEVIIAPSVDDNAKQVLLAKPNVRLLTVGNWANKISQQFDYKRLTGGLLIQDNDIGVIDAKSIKIVTKREPTKQEFNDLIFAWQVAKFVKSNAIVYAFNGQTLGIGAGQMSRVASSEIGVMQAAKAGLNLSPSVLASDAFFPFTDGVTKAAEAGCTAIVQPGGSIRDNEVIEAANKLNIAMVFTGLRHFRH